MSPRTKWLLPAAFMAGWHYSGEGMTLSEFAWLARQHVSEGRDGDPPIMSDPDFRDGAAEAETFEGW